MYTYSIVIFCIIGVIIFITNQCIIEGLESDNILPPNAQFTQSLNNASTNLEFYTANGINYKLLDMKIEYIEREYAYLDSIYKGLAFAIGDVSTVGSSTDKPTIYIGGNYPSRIKLNFEMPPPKPGIRGEEGVQGITGPDGKRGIQGVVGINGGNKMC